ncbi:MAG TPA: MerR family transcriptional regulator [Candidatus Dormibacteraeota bacterium]|nr:MerR family transcriptional regulator [Candidatus Dormibacteraeota bacterium]
MSDREQVRIEVAAQRSGLTKRAIRYYEELGLIQPTGRSESGHRLYTAVDIRRLEKIRMLRETVGLSLLEIQQLLEAEAALEEVRERYRRSAGTDERMALLQEAIASVSSQLRLITRKREALAQLQVEYEDRLARLRAALADLASEPAARGA